LRSAQPLFCLVLIICSVHAYAQFELTPVPRTNSHSKKNSARSKEVIPKKLPFWDDFSFARGSEPVDSLWANGSNSVWLNNGIGINPPSLGVITFDGLDSLGQPYNVNDILAKGFADNLISQPIRLDLIDSLLRPTVYISFYYQIKGRGELPDAGDLLRLQMLDSAGSWLTVWSMENDNTQQTDQFYQAVVAVPVAEDQFFFHDKFQFRFQNFARLSGPYDTWNLDYVYLNQGRSETDTSYPDRTLSNPLTSLFKEYYAIPVKHFLKNPDTLLNHAKFTMYNLRADNDQPLNYNNTIEVKNFVKGNIIVHKDLLDSAESVGSVKGLTQKTAAVKTPPPLDFFSSDADSLEINFELSLSTKDNVVPVNNGDYDVAKYAPVDFRWNDTTRTNYLLSNYYAYDDGTAEYGAGIKGFGVEVMYRFDMAAEVDTLVGINFYFPRFGDETTQLIQLQVYNDLTGTQASTLYSESATVQRSEQNKFIKYSLDRFVIVQKTFYIGWKQNTATAISVGLDKNTDASNKIYFNTSGTWEQDSTTRGSLMIRPVFGKGGAIVGLPENSIVKRVYPNPNKGSFFLAAQAENIKVYDLTGREIDFYSESLISEQRIDLTTHLSGIYIVRYLLDEKINTEKIIVQK
jgi:hypothetical protein